jgi:molybdopterin-containing oxidoreductase family iron-sulfur binding subunit
MGRGVNRRGFLKYMSFSGAFALFEKSKTHEVRRLIPYLIPPDNITPGLSSWYATVCRECPAGCGMHVRNREGRAVKVEGNPNHPVNRGALCARGQAAVQGLYNPDRIREPLLKGSDGGFRPITWEEAEKTLWEKLRSVQKGEQKGKVVLLTPLITGSLLKLAQGWTEAVGPGEHHIYEPFAYEELRSANGLTFGREEVPQYRIDKAEMLISMGAEFLDNWISPVEHSRGFGDMHGYRVEGVRKFVSIEPRRSLAAANADEWLHVMPGSEAAVALGMVNVILERGLNAPLSPGELALLKKVSRDFNPQRVQSISGLHHNTLVKISLAFAAARPGLALGPSMTAGGKKGMDTAVATNLLNYVCGNVGETVLFGMDLAISNTPKYEQTLKLIQSMQEGEVGLLLFNNVNPAYHVPPAAGFREAMGKVPFKVALSSYQDETSALADMVLPAATSLEEWGDYSPRKGVVGLMQPSMRPLFESRSLGELLLTVGRGMDGESAKKFPWKNYHQYLQEYWKRLQGEYGEGEDFRDFWEASLRRGGVWKETDGERPSLSRGLSGYDINPPAHGAEEKGSIKVIAYPGTLFDGRAANRPWMQELPDPLHKIVWDTWVELNPQTGRELKIRENDLVAVVSGEGRIEVPALFYDGMPEGVVAMPLGQGHTDFGRYASGVGASPLRLLAGEADEVTGGLRWGDEGIRLLKIKGRRKLVSTRGNKQQLGREVVQVVAGAAFKLVHEVKKFKPPRLPGRTGFYKEHPHPEHRWGMVIDLQKCTGCSACVVACYAENNLAVVGKKQVMAGREMAWISIQVYNGEGEEGSDRLHFIPMLCQQCDYAPCEPVCPVYAAYHTEEGLNAQVYNRCVGTRYCSNNCPYKARRFNWFAWEWPEPLNWQLNPDVAVRSKGVMEKCTFCVQRIEEVKNRAKDEGRKVRDGEIVPACAQTCPTGAITFGDLKDENSEVYRLSKDERGYHVLEELNTAPAITYLKKVL